MVTAAGDLVHASENENQDLFWALRGGGGNFGVVTLFEFDLHPLQRDILAGLLVFPAEQGNQVLRQYRDCVADLPEESNIWVVLRKAPPLPFLPDPVHGRDVVVLAIFHSGDHQKGQTLVESLRNFAQPYGEHVGAMPYSAWQQAFDPLLTPGARNYWKSHNFTEITDDAIATILDYARQLPSDQTEMFIGLLGGQITRIDHESTAYRQRDARFVLNVHARWDNPAEDRLCIDWARQFFDATAPFATGGVYINFMTGDEKERIKAAYGTGYQRLVSVKNAYDSQNLFRMNQNIEPA
jgi:FAD/FMN-containing dehydrogenase